MSDDQNEHNPYAPPRPIATSEERGRPRGQRFSNEGVTAWQEDGRILAPRFGGELPDRCVVCNKHTTYKLTRTFQWHAPGYYLLICAGWIVYLIALLIVRKTATLQIGLCDEHEARRKNGLMITWLGLGAGVLFMVLGGTSNSPVLMMVGLVGLLVGLVVGGIRSRVVRVWKIDESHVWLLAGPEFVRSLPTSPDGDEPGPTPAPRKKKKKRAKKPAVTVDDELREMLEDSPEETPEEKPAKTPEEKPAAEGDEES